MGPGSSYTIQVIGFALLAYVIGSIPFSYLIPKIFSGKDIRDHGSGNVGTSNVTRICGPSYGVFALLLDVGKGAASVLIVSAVGFPPVLGAVSIAGHIFSPFLRFSGGKGVATTLGVLTALSWVAGLIFVALWVGCVLIWKIAAISSLVAVTGVPISLFFLGVRGNQLWVVLGITIVIFLTHHENISRLIKGKEKTIR